MTTNWIKVNSGGSLIAGSTVAGCAISAKIIVTLTGDRTANSDMGVDPYDGGKLGSKGIGNLFSFRITYKDKLLLPGVL